MTEVSSINKRTYLQYCLIIIGIWVIGFFMRSSASGRVEVSEENAPASTLISRVINSKDENIPEMSEKYFGNEKKWEKYRYSQEGKKGTCFSVEGSLGHDPITAELIISPDGKIVGRYHNSNGTNLDVNGIVENDETIILNLGHKSASTFSSCKLKYLPEESDSDKMVLKGEWGKNNSIMMINLKYNQN